MIKMQEATAFYQEIVWERTAQTFDGIMEFFLKILYEYRDFFWIVMVFIAIFAIISAGNMKRKEEEIGEETLENKVEG